MGFWIRNCASFERNRTTATRCIRYDTLRSRWTVAAERASFWPECHSATAPYVKDELHYKGVFARELDDLRRALDRATAEHAEIDYVSHIYDDYYREVSNLERYLVRADTVDYGQLTDGELIDAVQQFFDLWTAMTMQIWYAVFLDIWYPSPNEQIEVKQIAAKARDLVGHLHEQSNSIERRLYAEAARRLHMTGEDIEYLFPHEIVDTLVNKTDNSTEIARRKQFCVTTSVEGSFSQLHRRAKYRRLKKVQFQAFAETICFNVKRLLTVHLGRLALQAT